MTDFVRNVSPVEGALLLHPFDRAIEHLGSRQRPMNGDSPVAGAHELLKIRHQRVLGDHPQTVLRHPRQSFLIDPPIDGIAGLFYRVEKGRRIARQIVFAKHRNIELSTQYRQQALFRERAEPDENVAQPAAVMLLESDPASEIAFADEAGLDQQLTDRSDRAEVLTIRPCRYRFDAVPDSRTLGDTQRCFSRSHCTTLTSAASTPAGASIRSAF